MELAKFYIGRGDRASCQGGNYARKREKNGIGLPGERAIRKALGSTLDDPGADLRKLYQAGRDKMFKATVGKIEDASSSGFTRP